ncbi:hypothetical protein EOJ36_09770 [Sandaracinomonas limnophila]|uniref:Uncharacterized protein n=1 Tax=Sandaracinomonas limnophila TaxID=1862386 RepID=A0A437PPW6_9BACT|nr:hypothetical protein [Sandaracinomonas limnophila]RVU24199.1 hypothetical protein EOJ36_09770 [Sandaracinomonas limnophila]
MKSAYTLKLALSINYILSLFVFTILTNFVTLGAKSEKLILNQPPEITWKHPEVIQIKSGSSKNLSYSCSDPEFHRMNANIRQVKDKGNGKSKLNLNATLNSVQIAVPASASSNETYFIQLEIKDEGNPPQSALQSIEVRII